MVKLARVLAVLCVAVLLAGCHGARETEEVAFVTALGLDSAADGKYKITFTVEIPRAVGASGGGGPEAPHGPAVVTSIVAPSVAEARNLLAATMSRFSDASHLKAILIGEDLARAGIRDIIAPFTRFREYRGTIFVFVVSGTAENFMLKNTPMVDYLPSKWYESMMISGEDSHYYLRRDLHDLYLGLKNPGRAAFTTYLAVNPLVGRDKPAGPRTPRTPADPYIAGGIPRSGTGNPAEVAGLAVFAADKMVGVLGTADTRILAILNNKYHNSRFVLDDPLQPGKIINIRLRNGAKPQIETELADGRMAIKIKVFLEAELSANPGGINYEKGEYRKLLEERVSAVITREIVDFVGRTQALGSDVFGFGRFLRSRYATYGMFVRAAVDSLYPAAAVEVAVITSFRRSGLMWRTTPFKNAATAQEGH
ncbi:MAG: Ger(x)C family spore germination protein [Sporomusaceae bacterium]|nr:Ger(x)C family spore germination protein [Sporomusaceae bacterium]